MMDEVLLTCQSMRACEDVCACALSKLVGGKAKHLQNGQKDITKSGNTRERLAKKKNPIVFFFTFQLVEF